jgi:hypothetical protein
MTEFFYVYIDKDNDKYFYLNATTNETTYERSRDGIFLDPETRQAYVFRSDDPPVSEPPPPKPESDAHAPPAPEPVGNPDGPAPEACCEREPELKHRCVSFLPEVRARALPISLRGDDHELQLSEFAGDNFREQYRGGMFSRKKVPPRKAAHFQADPLKLPLLQATMKQSTKAALECFKLILSYSGANPKDKTRPGGAATASRLLALMAGDSNLCDEGYFQLAKQTRHNPNNACLRRTWELFVIVVSNIPATPKAEKWIRAHIYQTCRDVSNTLISELAQFAYIRFNSRCLVGQPVYDVPLPLIEQTPRDVSESFRAFGASIYEQLWNQRTRYPNAPIPLTVHWLAEALIEKGAERREGIFRLPGNQARVKEMQNAINEGKSPYTSADLNDLGSLFKSWFGSLPEMIIDRMLLPKLEIANEGSRFICLLTELPPASLAVLKYLVGFLKRLCRHEATTMMGSKNLAICFAPNLVDTSPIKDPMQARLYAEMAQCFFQQLIEGWDTRDLYPLKQSHLEK